MPKICLSKQRATEIGADALVVAVDTAGRPLGETHDFIRAVVGNYFHNHLTAHLPLSIGTALFVPRIQMYPIRYAGVIFIVDESERDIDTYQLEVRSLIYNALLVADREHMRTLTIVMPRADTSDKRVGGAFEASCSETRAAIDAFHENFPNSRLHKINVYVGVHSELLSRATQVM